MNDDDVVRRPKGHEIGMLLDALEPVARRAAPIYTPDAKPRNHEHSMGESLDLLDLALELGEADGLLVPVGAATREPAPSAHRSWRLHDPDGAELPLL